jgi:hypothetical protein
MTNVGVEHEGGLGHLRARWKRLQLDAARRSTRPADGDAPALLPLPRPALNRIVRQLLPNDPKLQRQLLHLAETGDLTARRIVREAWDIVQKLKAQGERLF